MSNQSHVAILGVGKMGAAMAKELVAAGHIVHLWNRNKNVADELAAALPQGSTLSHDTAHDALAVADFAI
jgi:3-hydroxyisobutyrate dehydrogenase